MRPKSFISAIAVAAISAASLQTAPALAEAGGVLDPQTRALQMQQYNEDRTKSILELQPFRTTQTAQGADGTSYELVSLNPGINSWYVLTVSSEGFWSSTRRFHLELADPEHSVMALAGGAEPELVITGEATEYRCAPWSGRSPELDEAQYRGLPFAPICEERVFLRNEVRGNSTNREAVAEFLRDNVVFGESIVNMIKGSFYEDAFMNSGPVVEGADAGETVELVRRERPDAVITDLEMPGRDGVELCSAIRNDPDIADTPVVIVSGSRDPVDHGRAIRAGATDVLAKPLRRLALLAAQAVFWMLISTRVDSLLQQFGVALLACASMAASAILLKLLPLPWPRRAASTTGVFEW